MGTKTEDRDQPFQRTALPQAHVQMPVVIPRQEHDRTRDEIPPRDDRER